MNSARPPIGLSEPPLTEKEAIDEIRALMAGLNKRNWFSVVQSPGGKAVGHSGGFPGINSQLDIYVDSGYIVAAMSNIDNGASPLANRIGRTLIRVKAQ